MNDAPATQPATGRRISVASVMAGGVETAYVRVGTGPTVLVLDTFTNAEHLARAIADRLGGCRCVFPHLPEALQDPATDDATLLNWLGGVLDGLGIEDAVVLARGGTLARVARAAGRADPDRVRAVAESVEDCLTLLA